MEKKVDFIVSGGFILFIQLIILLFLGYWIYSIFETHTFFEISISVIVFIVWIIVFCGFVKISINNANVYQLLGKYKGSIKENGYFWINPFYVFHNSLSLALTNHKTKVLEVNERTGIPIEIAAMITFKITDSYKATYSVENLTQYIDNQFSIGLREFAKNHTYQQLAELDHNFIDLINKSVQDAGITVIEAKITQLNYVESVSAGMLQKQQAQSMSDARELIVSNAIHIAQKAAKELNLSMQTYENFVKDLVLILCSHTPVSPIINVGTK